MVVWDREDYLKEAESRLSDERVYEGIFRDVVSLLAKTIKYHLAKVKTIGGINNETLDYFMVKNPRLGRFYLLPKIHKRHKR